MRAPAVGLQELLAGPETMPEGDVRGGGDELKSLILSLPISRASPAPLRAPTG